MTASSQYGAEYAPSGGRLNYQAQIDSQGDTTQIGGWGALTADVNQWLQIKFSQIFQISGVATQGRADAAQWVKTYKLEYSTEGSTWTYYPNVSDFNHDFHSRILFRQNNSILQRILCHMFIEWCY